MESWIYVEKLVDGKYYIGKTNNKEKRHAEHANGVGSAWTAKYKPTGEVEYFPEASRHHENNLTKDYMEKYGIKNVRGGSYCQVVLPDETIAFLNVEIWALSASFFCHRCGFSNHGTADCFSKKNKNGELIPVKIAREVKVNVPTMHVQTMSAQSAPVPSYPLPGLPAYTTIQLNGGIDENSNIETSLVATSPMEKRIDATIRLSFVSCMISFISLMLICVLVNK